LCIHSVDFWQKLAEVVDGLAADGRLFLKPLVTHVLGFEEAGKPSGCWTKIRARLCRWSSSSER
jgi:hypothetical protein